LASTVSSPRRTPGLDDDLNAPATFGGRIPKNALVLQLGGKHIIKGFPHIKGYNQRMDIYIYPQRNCVTQRAGHDQMRAQGTKSQGAEGLEPFLTDSLLVLGKGQSREQSILRRLVVYLPL